jgi:hypothetical protein
MTIVLLSMWHALVAAVPSALSDSGFRAWGTAVVAAALLGYSWMALLGSASVRPRRFQGRHRRPAA